VVKAQQLIGRRGRHDVPRRQGGSAGRQGVELPPGIDIAVIGVDERGRDARSRRRVPLRVAADRAVSGLLAVRRCRQRRLRGRRIAHSMFVGDEVVGELRGVSCQSRLRALRCVR
jgi:hypothetical protein